MSINKEDQRILDILDSLGGIKTRKKEVEELRALFLAKLKRESLFEDNSIRMYDTHKNPQFKEDLNKCLSVLHSLLNFSNTVEEDKRTLYGMKSDLLHIIELNDDKGLDITPHALELTRVIRDIKEVEDFTRDTMYISSILSKYKSAFADIRQALLQGGQQ